MFLSYLSVFSLRLSDVLKRSDYFSKYNQSEPSSELKPTNSGRELADLRYHTVKGAIYACPALLIEI